MIPRMADAGQRGMHFNRPGLRPRRPSPDRRDASAVSGDRRRQSYRVARTRSVIVAGASSRGNGARRPAPYWIPVSAMATRHISDDLETYALSPPSLPTNCSAVSIALSPRLKSSRRNRQSALLAAASGLSISGMASASSIISRKLSRTR